jgi:predicted ATP-dependent endonuclease of OLD family
MKIKKILIKNVKSFKEEVVLIFDGSFNILIGPNGGGKSNLLDIITIVIRKFFVNGYDLIEGSDEIGYFNNIITYTPFEQIHKLLDKFYRNDVESLIELTLQVSNNDINNLEMIKENKINFENALHHYRNGTSFNLSFLDSLKIDSFFEGQELTYKIRNNEFFSLANESPEFFFKQYLNYLELFLILSKHIDGIKLNPIYLYFSPYRGETPNNLQANLSGQNFYNILRNYLNSTSRNNTSLIGLASIYFAEKRRKYEDSAKDDGYHKKWTEDEEVILVTRYLNMLGYSWDLKLINVNKNIYEIVLTKEGKEFSIVQASSGEKEIINFLFGIFALNIKNGLIIVDEPELHLHPKWQIVLVNLFIEMARTTNCQFIISTHSAVFINQNTIENIIRIYKTSDNSSQAIKVQGEYLSNAKNLLHIVNSHNNEKIFFADKVVLVEGIMDRLIFEKLINYILKKSNISEIYEVLEVHGKINLSKYREFLNVLSIKNYIISDFDYIYDIGDDNIKKLFITDYNRIDESIKDKKSKDGESLARSIESAIESNDISNLKILWEYIKGRKRRLKEDLTEDEKLIIKKFICEKQAEKIYILQQGEIEAYLPVGFKKLENVIELVKDEKFIEWIQNPQNTEFLKELISIVMSVLEISSEECRKLGLTYL